MKVFKVGDKLIPDAEVMGLVAEAKGLSFTVESFHFDGKSVMVKVRATDGRRVEEEVVAFTLQSLLDQLNLETGEEKRKLNEIRVKNYAVQFAVQRAKKVLTGRFKRDRSPYLPEPLKEFEVVELLSLYTPPEGVSYLVKLSKESPELAVELARTKDVYTFIPLSEAQRKLIKVLQKKCELSEDDYRKLLKKRYGVSSSKLLSRDEAKDFIDYLKSVCKETVQR